MELSKEVIQTRVFDDFEIQLNTFHKQCENDYFDKLRTQIISGDINLHDLNYRELCYEKATKYKQDLRAKIYIFVRDYINKTFDMIDDSLREGLLTDDEAAAAFIALKHILIAAEIDSENTSPTAL